MKNKVQNIVVLFAKFERKSFKDHKNNNWSHY
jgi:hypothetical protein